VEWNGKVFKLVDTGGIVFDSSEAMDRMIRHQALLAIDESDFIIFMVDAMRAAPIWTSRSPKSFIRIEIK
jgi:predicted GTPase